jgi:3-methyladenine DNA glycosylase/8-oxoguanine DNA glycosylase
MTDKTEIKAIEKRLQSIENTLKRIEKLVASVNKINSPQNYAEALAEAIHDKIQESF